MTSFSPSLNDLPFLDIKVDLLAVYLFVFPCYDYQSFLSKSVFFVPLVRGLLLRASGPLNSQIAGVLRFGMVPYRKYTAPSILASAGQKISGMIVNE